MKGWRTRRSGPARPKNAPSLCQLHTFPLSFPLSFPLPSTFQRNGGKEPHFDGLTPWAVLGRLTDGLGIKSCEITLLAALLSFATVRVGTGMLCLAMRCILLLTAEPHIRPLISCVEINFYSQHSSYALIFACVRASRGSTPLLRRHSDGVTSPAAIAGRPLHPPHRHDGWLEFPYQH